MAGSGRISTLDYVQREWTPNTGALTAGFAGCGPHGDCRR